MNLLPEDRAFINTGRFGGFAIRRPGNARGKIKSPHRRETSMSTMALTRDSSAGYLTRAPRSSGLADVLEILLDRGLVIDAFVRVSLVGIELLTVDLRIVVASVDTYLRFAEAVNRLDLQQVKESKSIPDLVEGETEEVSEGKAKGAVSGGVDAVAEKVGLKRGEKDEEKEEK
jgi:gas vesicle structural protein